MQKQGGDRVSLLHNATINVMHLTARHCFYGAGAGVLLAFAVRRPKHAFGYIGLSMGIASGFTLQRGNEFIVFKRSGGN